MNSIGLEDAIRARIVASLSTASVTVQGVWAVVAPIAVEVKQGLAPVVIFSLTAAETDDTFNDNGFRADYRVSVYDSKSNGTTNVKPAYDAIIGNGTPSTAPTMGLHRWQPTVSGQAVSQMRMTAFGSPHTADTLEYYADFEVYAEEV